MLSRICSFPGSNVSVGLSGRAVHELKDPTISPDLVQHGDDPSFGQLPIPVRAARATGAPCKSVAPDVATSGTIDGFGNVSLECLLDNGGDGTYTFEGTVMGSGSSEVISGTYGYSDFNGGSVESRPHRCSHVGPTSGRAVWIKRGGQWCPGVATRIGSHQAMTSVVAFDDVRRVRHGNRSHFGRGGVRRNLARKLLFFRCSEREGSSHDNLSNHKNRIRALR